MIKPAINTARLSSQTQLIPFWLVVTSLQTYQPATWLAANTGGKCQGMTALDRLNILHTAFHTAKHKILHYNISPAP